MINLYFYFLFLFIKSKWNESIPNSDGGTYGPLRGSLWAPWTPLLETSVLQSDPARVE